MAVAEAQRGSPTTNALSHVIIVNISLASAGHVAKFNISGLWESLYSQWGEEENEYVLDNDPKHHSLKWK